MSYSVLYNASDVPEIVIDALGGIGVQVVAFGGLVALVLLYAWYKKSMRGR